MDETEQDPVGVGDTICDSRYNIIRLLGGGIHATVWLAFDKIDNHHVSIKISKSQLPTNEPTNEVEYLRKIAKANPNHPGYIHVLHFLDAFHLRGSRGFHQCIVTEVLGPSIHTFRTTRNSLSLPLHIAKAVTFQLLLALDYLHNTCGIIHTDLKADNILVAIDNPEHAIQEFLKDAETSVVKATFGRNDTNAIPVECTDPSNITIKLIDYGNACWTGRNSHDIQPFAYRAPEVILGAEWGSGVDIWNLACMVYEITTSRRLFYAEREDDGVEKLKGIMKLLGPIPPNVIKSGTRSSQFFDDEGNFCCPDVPCIGMSPMVAFVRPDEDSQENENLASFLRNATALCPRDRWGANDLIIHIWMEESYNQYLLRLESLESCKSGGIDENKAKEKTSVPLPAVLVS